MSIFFRQAGFLPCLLTRGDPPLQFHWQDYSDKNYLTALHTLLDLKTEGLISAIGLCNFDAIRTDEICTELGPGAIVSNQVQVRYRISIENQPNIDELMLAGPINFV